MHEYKILERDKHIVINFVAVICVHVFHLYGMKNVTSYPKYCKFKPGLFRCGTLHSRRSQGSRLWRAVKIDCGIGGEFYGEF
jgi:hypothetical protein